MEEAYTCQECGGQAFVIYAGRVQCRSCRVDYRGGVMAAGRGGQTVNEWDADEQVIAAATPGPWRTEGYSVDYCGVAPATSYRLVGVRSNWGQLVRGGYCQPPPPDMAFCARARTRWPAWVARCKAAEAIVRDAARMVDDFDADAVCCAAAKYAREYGLVTEL